MHLYNSVNFDSDESVRKLADILAIAPVLKKCDIGYQEGNRKISVDVEYATEVSLGAIVIKSSGQEIHRRETDKKAASHRMSIQYR